MADRLPPSRYSVVERGGRLVVIDRDTGRTPPTAAERMADHDRRMGNERIVPAARPAANENAAPETATAAAAKPAPQRQPARPSNDRAATAAADMTRRQPWSRKADDAARPQPARIAARPQPTGRPGARKTIVTGKWWDSKGPRTIDLGPQGQRELTGAFMMLFFVALIAAIVALFVAPVILFAAAFLLFRFGGKILGPIGAGFVDKALAERN